jgi:ornithine cyclodeaminase
MQEFPPELLVPKRYQSSSKAPRISRILVDSRSACLAEAGELIAAGIEPSCLVELGEVVRANGAKDEDALKRAQLRSTGFSLFKCVGVGGMDVAVTDLVVTLAQERGIGTNVEY